MDFKPPLPTDNLYKFMALFGLALVILWFVAFHEYSRLDVRAILLCVESLKIASENVKLVSVIEEPTSSDSTKQYNQQIYDRNKAVLRANNEELRQLSNEIKLKKLELRYNYIFFLITGIILSIAGFGLWYFKLQRYQDRLIKSQAAE